MKKILLPILLLASCAFAMKDEAPELAPKATTYDYLNILTKGVLIVSLAPVVLNIVKSVFAKLTQESKTEVGIISVSGPIKGSSRIITDLTHYFENNAIKAIILRIDSPGGDAGSSQAIYNEIVAYKKLYPEKYVIAYVENIAASGGYYIAAGADYIISTPAAFVGSIGAIISWPNVKKLADNYNVKFEVVHSGSHKTTGSPFLDVTMEQRAALQTTCDEIYTQFTTDVAKCRPQLSTDTKTWADGKIFSGQQALQLHLIDELGSQSSVTAALRSRAKIEGPIHFVKPVRKSFFGFSANEDEGDGFVDTMVNKLFTALEQRYAASSVKATV